ncbi:hypothetical protein Tco_1092418 [Tanacetum coccineum]|uniref:Retrovirus-related Pol polyprotein from transposon TNT 1-94-like beta-barrel domain-containing protein n=1 Tax=Tanacetum coccineum TaxID=301880 RepID=A0ABQ5IB58_9ASTR
METNSKQAPKQQQMFEVSRFVEQEVKGTASSSSQNLAFVSSTSSTNEVDTVYGVSTANTQVSTISTQVSTANLNDLEELDLTKWLFALLSIVDKKVLQEKLVKDLLSMRVTQLDMTSPRPKVVNIVRPNTAVVNAVRANQVNAIKASACWGHPQKEDQGYVDSGCSRHMTGNMSYLSDFKEFDGGYATFGGGGK